MADYITATDVQNRLTTIGYEFLVDRDESGTGITDAEVAQVVTPAIQYAGALVDEAIATFSEPSHARAAGNQWLKDRCLDIACYQVALTGGQNVPTAFQERNDFSLGLLDDLKQGRTKVPDYVYSTPPGGSGQSTRGPRVLNPRD